MPNWKKLITSGSSASLTSLTLTSLPGQGSEATSVMINAGGTLGTRELGSLAFSSATYDNYSAWNLKTDSTSRTFVSSGGALDIIGGTQIGVSYSAGGKVTINNSITNTNQLTNGSNYLTLANNADNRIVTATGNSTPNAEANLTYDGSTLYVYGATAGDTVLDIQGTQGQLFSITDDLTGDLFSVADISGTPVLAVSASGLVEIDDTLKVVTSIGVGTDPTTTVGEIRATNDITAYYSSDKRLKENITPIVNSLDKLKQIKGVSFDWIPKEGIHSHEGHDVGVIAQDIEKVLPELVENRDNGYKAVRYEKLVALLIETNKELLKRVEELEKKL